MKKAFLLFLFTVSVVSKAQAASVFASSGVYGYVAVSGGQTIRTNDYDKNRAHSVYAVSTGLGIPFVRLEEQLLTIDRHRDDPDNSRRMHAVFTNVLLGEIVYAGVGWGYGEWSDSVTDVYQFIGGAEIPLGPYFRVGGEYHSIYSRKEPSDLPRRFKAQVFMGRLTVNF